MANQINTAATQGNQYVVVNDEVVPTNPTAEIDEARAAMLDAEINELPIWHGSPDCTDSYRDANAKIFA